MAKNILQKKCNLHTHKGFWIKAQSHRRYYSSGHEVGLNNINDIDNSEKWKSQAFTLFAGITF